MLATISPQLRVSYDEAGSGPALVLLHAFPQARAMWQMQLENLSRDFRVLCPDLPGFGGSRSASTCSIQSMADDIAAWLRHLKIEKATVGGVSMGGYVALALALNHPDLLSGLVLASTRADADSEEARAGREKMIAFAQENDARAVFEKMAPRLFCQATRDERPELVEQAALVAEPISRRTIVSALAALRDRPDARAFLSRISVPTLVLLGARDEVSPLDSALEMSGAIADSCLQVLERAGHFAHLEQPADWNQAVRDWAFKAGLVSPP